MENNLTEDKRDKEHYTLHFDTNKTEHNDAVRLLFNAGIDKSCITQPIYVPVSEKDTSLLYIGEISRVVLNEEGKIEKIILKPKDVAAKSISDENKAFTLDEFKALLDRQSDIIEKQSRTVGVDVNNLKVRQKVFKTTERLEIPREAVIEILKDCAKDIKDKVKQGLISEIKIFEAKHKTYSKEDLFEYLKLREPSILNQYAKINPDLFMDIFDKYDQVTDNSMYLEKLIANVLKKDGKFSIGRDKEGEIHYFIRRDITGYGDTSDAAIKNIINKYSSLIQIQKAGA